MSSIEKEVYPQIFEWAVFFDADHTLWTIESQWEDDWASKGRKPGDETPLYFESIGQDAVKRIEDGSIFRIKPGVIETLQRLKREESIRIGIISDNRLQDVRIIAEKLGIWDLFSPDCTNILLWTGTADKKRMINESIDSLRPNIIKNVVLIDDSAKYRDQMGNDISFILSPKDTFPGDEIFHLVF